MAAPVETENAMGLLDPVIEATLRLKDLCLEKNESNEELVVAIESHIEKFMNEAQCMPEFKSGSSWINIATGLRFNEELKGKVVVLDFFTYCCINCLHILPYIAALEKKVTVSDGLVIIGVHSAKFDNERSVENVEKAVVRHQIQHPVVVDDEGWLWNKLNISCWPTLLIIGPEGQILFVLIGECFKDYLELFTIKTLDYFRKRNRISSTILAFSSTAVKNSFAALHFPAKICFDPSGELLAIADSGNHRILVVTKSGNLKHCIGGREAGFQDGDFQRSRFSLPQGICWSSSEKIVVADTENHALREINLLSKSVRTLAGTGRQGDVDNIDPDAGIKQSLNSPWDVCLDEIENEANVLLIAMAGHHQIWVYFLRDGRWPWLSLDFSVGDCVSIAGTGKEENRNNFYPERAAFAQPSGLVTGYSTGMKSVFIADSESSSIRVLNLQTGGVKGLVGGDFDPLNLFAFGDKDGKGFSAKLQHPMGIAWNRKNGFVYVADTFNHKIKLINPEHKSCTTIAGTGNPGSKVSNDPLQTEFNEPNGLTFDHEYSLLYIADTNNHSIKILDLQRSIVSQFDIHGPSDHVDNMEGMKKSKRKEPHHVIPHPCVETQGTVILKPRITFANGISLNDDAPHSCNAYLSDFTDQITITQLPSEQIWLPSFKISSINKSLLSVIAEVEITAYCCSKLDGSCWMKTIVFRVPLSFTGNGTAEEKLIHLSHCIGGR